MPGVAVRFRALTTKKLRLEMAPAHTQIRAFITTYLQGVQAVVSKYPPVPPNSRYVRTGDLFRGWHITGQGGFDQSLVASSRAGGARREYAKFVHGNKFGDEQMWYHAANGWKRIADYYDREHLRSGVQDIYHTVRIA